MYFVLISFESSAVELPNSFPTDILTPREGQFFAYTYVDERKNITYRQTNKGKQCAQYGEAKILDISSPLQRLTANTFCKEDSRYPSLSFCFSTCSSSIITASQCQFLPHKVVCCWTLMSALATLLLRTFWLLQLCMHPLVVHTRFSSPPL